jgi:DHA1 family multidrug resistance protein-like MFS transporter
VLHWAVSHTIKSVFPVLALSIFSSMMGIGIIAPLLPIYAENLGATGVWIGIIFSGYAVSRTILLPFAGRLSDRRGRKIILSIGLFAFAITSFAYVLADNIALLLIIRLLQGASFSFVQPIAQAYIGDIAPEGEEGKWMGLLNAAFFIGWGSGPLIGGVLAEHLGIDSVFYTMGALNMLAFVVVAFFLPEITHRERASVAGASFREVISSSVTRGLFSFNLGVASHRGIVQTFIPIFAALTIGLSTSLVGTILTVIVLGASLIQIPAGQLADRFNRRVIVIIGCAGILVSMLIVPQARSFWPLLVFLAIAGIGDAVALPSASALVIEEGRKFGMGMAMAVFNMGMGVGMSIGPILAGLVADYLGVQYAFYFAAAIIFISAVAFSQFTRKHFGARV